MATHSCILAWRIPGTEKPVGLSSMGSHRVGHDWRNTAAAAASEYTHTIESEKEQLLSNSYHLLFYSNSKKNYFTGNYFANSLVRSKQKSLFLCILIVRFWFSSEQSRGYVLIFLIFFFLSKTQGVVSIYTLVFLSEWTKRRYNLHTAFYTCL